MDIDRIEFLNPPTLPEELLRLSEQAAEDARYITGLTFAGMPIQVSSRVPDNEVHFRHADGRLDRLIFPEA